MVARDRQRNRGFFGGLLRDVSDPREGSKILTFPFWPRLMCGWFLQLRSSGKGISANFASMSFSEVRQKSVKNTAFE